MPQRISYKICLLTMFKCLKGLTIADLSDLCIGTGVAVGSSGLRFIVQGDLVVPGHKTDGVQPFEAVSGGWSEMFKQIAD